MGYSLYVTRRDQWFDEAGPAIQLDDWVSLVEDDPDLRWAPEIGEYFAVLVNTSSEDVPWLAWDNGNLESKYPSKAMIRKMHAIASSLGAHLVGEEGERYDSSGEQLSPLPPIHPRRGLLDRIRALFSHTQASEPGLPVGCRVKDAWGQMCAVTKVDLRTQNGLGEITVRYDDGRIATFSAIAHGLERQAP